MSTPATNLRQAIITRLAALPGYVSRRFTPLPQIQPEQLPCLSVYIKGEQLVSLGDAETGEPKFVSTVTIAISDVRGFDTPENLDGQVDAAIDAIENQLLTDPSFTTKDPTKTLFQGVTRISRTRNFPQQGETYFSELRLEMDFEVAVDYPPVIPDTFTDMRVVTQVVDEDTPQTFGGAGKNNLGATTDPGASNDVTQGYAPHSVWINTTTHTVWTCVDATSAAAVWAASGIPSVISDIPISQ